MAQTDTPYGFRLNHHISGEVRASKHIIASAYGTAIYPGDWVKLVAAGTIERAAAGDLLLGVFQGCSYTLPSGEHVFSPIWPASTTLKSGTTAEAMVLDDPNLEWVAQIDSAVNVAGIGALYDIVATAGNATLNAGREDVNGGSLSTSDGQLRLIGFVDAPGNDVTASYADGIFRINEHAYAAAKSGV